ncbi:MAG: endonuclease dU [Thermoplasmata archaeon]
MISLGRALQRPHPRILGVDDGAFVRTAVRAPLAAILLSLPRRIEAVGRSFVTVDGTDASDRILDLVRATAHVADLRALLLDGPLVGGFNVVDLDRLAEELQVPIVTVSRHRPDLGRIRAVLERYFPEDAAERWRFLRRHPPRPWDRGPAPLWGSVLGAHRRDAARLLERAAVEGRWPEPLRLAHLVASAGRRRPAGGSNCYCSLNSNSNI